jgi:hypothetical protein
MSRKDQRKGSSLIPKNTMNLWPALHDLLNERTFSPATTKEAAMWIIAIILLPLIVIALSSVLCEVYRIE